MEILAIIPARGGSKGVPRKNIRPLADKPLIAWTIMAAKASRYITRVICSTDDQEISDVALAYGAEVPFMRPDHLAADLSTDVDFLTHALQWLEVHESYRPDIVIRLPPTSPLRTSFHIDEGVEKILAHPEADACRPITEAPKHPYKMWRIAQDEAYLEPFLPTSFTHMEEPYNLPRQLLPKAYIHTGAMDIMRVDTILKLKSTSGKKMTYFFMPLEDSVNIDHVLDFELAELLMRKRLNPAAPL